MGSKQKGANSLSHSVTQWLAKTKIPNKRPQFQISLIETLCYQVIVLWKRYIHKEAKTRPGNDKFVANFFLKKIHKLISHWDKQLWIETWGNFLQNQRKLLFLSVDTFNSDFN